MRSPARRASATAVSSSRRSSIRRDVRRFRQTSAIAFDRTTLPSWVVTVTTYCPPPTLPAARRQRVAGEDDPGEARAERAQPRRVAAARALQDGAPGEADTCTARAGSADRSRRTSPCSDRRAADSRRPTGDRAAPARGDVASTTSKSGAAPAGGSAFTASGPRSPPKPPSPRTKIEKTLSNTARPSRRWCAPRRPRARPCPCRRCP